MLVGMGVLVARWAGPADFGVLSAIISVGAVLFVVSDFGMSTFISRAVATGDNPGVASALRVNTMTTVGGGFLAVAAIAAFAAAGGISYGTMMLGAALALEKNTDTALSIPIANGIKAVPAQSLLLRRSVGLSALLILHAVGIESIDSYSASFLIGSIFGQVHMRLSLRSWYGHGTKRSGLLREAFPFLVSNVSASARNLDTAIVSAAVSSQAGGLYAAAQRIISPFMLIPGVIASLVLPHSSRGSGRRAMVILHKLVLTHFILLLLMAGVVPFAGQLMVFVLGDQYAKSANIFVWLLLAFPFIALSSPMGGVLQSQGYEKLVAHNGFWFGIALIPALWIGALFGGAVGCAICLFGVYAIKCLALYVLARKRLF